MEGKVTESNSSSTAQSDLASELSRLGENLGKLVKATWESDERKSIENELKSGLEQLNKQVNGALEQTRTDQNLRRAREKIKDTWETAHGPQIVREMELGIVDSLKRLNDEIAKRAEAKPAQEVNADEPAKPAEEVKP